MPASANRTYKLQLHAVTVSVLVRSIAPTTTTDDRDDGGDDSHGDGHGDGDSL